MRTAHGLTLDADPLAGLLDVGDYLAVGYQDATTLATPIRRRRGTTPEQIRRRRLATASSWPEPTAADGAGGHRTG